MKLTDEMIIYALERCSLHKECCYCNAVEECGSKKVLTNSVLDLINRQKAENERLQADNERLKHILVNFMVEIEDWEYKYNIDTSNIPKIAILGMEKAENIKAIRGNAIKEFATFLKHLINQDLYHSGRNIVVKIDNLVKEMVGSDK